MYAFDLGLRCKTLRFLEGFYEWPGFQVEGVRQGRKAVLLRVVQKPSFLKEKGNVVPPLGLSNISAGSHPSDTVGCIPYP